jgi:hemolysin III
VAVEVSSGAIAPPRPALRGVLHLCAVVAASVGLVVMLLLAHNARGYVGASIFGSSLIAVYLTSASYHLPRWRPLMSNLMRRLDHAMIFFLIAGTYTPFCLIVIDQAWSIALLSTAVIRVGA